MHGTWVVALLLPLGLYGLGIAISDLSGHPVHLSQFFGSQELGQVGPLIVLVEVVFFGLGEEIGWRGFLIPHIESSGRSPYMSSTLFAPIWAAWHFPLFFYAYGLGSMSPLMIPGWFVSVTLSTYLISWVFHRSGGSILVVAVFHGMVDLVSITTASSAIVLIVINAGLIGVSVLAVTRSRVLTQAVGNARTLDAEWHSRSAAAPP